MLVFQPAQLHAETHHRLVHLLPIERVEIVIDRRASRGHLDFRHGLGGVSVLLHSS